MCTATDCMVIVKARLGVLVLPVTHDLRESSAPGSNFAHNT